LAGDVSVEDDVDLAVSGESCELVGSDGDDGVSGLLGEPVDHELLAALSAVLDLHAVVEEEEGGEALHAVAALHGGVRVAVHLRQTHGGTSVLEFGGDLVVDGGETFAVAAPGSVELDEDEGELLDDAGEVLGGEDEDVVLFSVGRGEEHHGADQEDLGD
jgi:hypothetical protein